MKGIATIAGLLTIACSGCAGGGKLPLPAERLMQTPAKLEDVKEGDDLIGKHAELRGNYTQCSSRLRGLQTYVRAATQ
jgi:hypothetical protein